MDTQGTNDSQDTQEEKMNTNDKIRTCVGILLMLTLAVCAIGYLIESKQVLIGTAIGKEITGKILIDGANFTGAVNLLSAAFSGFLIIIVSITYAIAILIYSLTVGGLYRLIALRKSVKTTYKEYSIISKAFLWISIATMFISILIGSWYLILNTIIFNAIWMLSTWLLIVYSTKRKMRKQEEEERRQERKC